MATYNPLETLAQNISTAGTVLGIPNLGISQGITQSPVPVQPYIGTPNVAPGSGTVVSPIQPGTNTTNPIGPGYGNYGSTDYYTPQTSGSTGSSSTGSTSSGGSYQDIFRSMYGVNETMPPGWKPPGVSDGIDEAAINAVYQPTMNYLNQAEQQIRGNYPNVLEAANKSAESALAELNASKTKNLGTIEQNLSTVGQQKEDALSAARRLYDELRRGYSQRFGGATSAGQAASELSAVEQQRQMGQTTRDYGTAVRQINQQKLQLDQDFQVGQAKIQEQKSLALQQAQTNFTNQLMQIQSQRAQTESQKSAAKLDALNQLKAQAFAIQQQAVTYQQNLDSIYRQQQADLATYAAKLNMSGMNAETYGASYKPTTPTTNLNIGGTGGTTNPQYTGSIKKDELLGSVSPTVGFKNGTYDPYGIYK